MNEAGDTPSVDALLGRTLAQRYRLDALLGKGGMGAVFRALTTDTSRAVAFKVVLPGESRQRLASRFMREARLSSRLAHQNIARVLDYGRWGSGRCNLYLVTELVDGVTMTELLDVELGLGGICDLADQVAAALAHVHAHNVLHRDIKPDNILVSRRPDGALRAQLTDFGLAAALASDEDGEATRLTRAGTVLGTPDYMAPEQAEGRQGLGPPTDLYALGILMYRLVSGRLPFEGALTRILLDKVNGKHAPLEPREGLALPAALRDTIERLLSPRPQDRFPLAADLRAALAPFAEPALLDASTWRTVRGAPEPQEASQTQIADGATIVDADMDTGVPAPGVETAATKVYRRNDQEEAAQPVSELVGRDEELATLERHAAAAEVGDGRVLVLEGDIGIGKTELAERFAISLNEAGRFSTLRAQAAPDTGALGAIRSALDLYLGTLGRPVAVVERAVDDLLARFDDTDPEERRALVALMRPEIASEPVDLRRAAALFVRMVRRLGRERPILVVLDDLQPDAPTAAFFELVVFELSLESMPALFVLPMRTIQDEHPMRAALNRTARAEGTVRHIMQLGPVETDTLARNLEASHGLPPHEAERVAKRAGGNPLFANHLARSGTSSDAGDTALVGRERRAGTSSFTTQVLPEPLRNILAASLEERIDRTDDPARSRALLEKAAVLGERVDVELLEALLDPEALRWIDHDLDALIDVDILEDAEGGLDADAVVFASRLLRDTVLSTLGRRRARRLHRRAAEVREQRGDPGDAGAIGEHLAAAGQDEQAIVWFQRAVERADRQGQGFETAVRGRQLLALLDDDDPRRGAVALIVGRVLRKNAELDEAEAVLRPFVEAADADLALQVAELVGEILQERAQFDEWQALTLEMKQRLDEASVLGRAAYLRASAFVCNLALKFERSIELAREALDLAQTPDDAVHAASRLMWAYLSLGHMDDAGSVVTEIESRAGDTPALHAEVLRLRVLQAGYGGDAAGVKALVPELLEAQRKSGRTARIVACTTDAAMAFGLTLQLDEALARANEASALAERFGLLMELTRAALVRALVGVARRDGEMALAELEGPYLSVVRDRRALFQLAYAAALALADRKDEAVEEARNADVDEIPYTRLFAMELEYLGGLLVDVESELARQFLEMARTRWAAIHDLGGVARCEDLIGEL